MDKEEQDMDSHTRTKTVTTDELYDSIEDQEEKEEKEEKEQEEQEKNWLEFCELVTGIKTELINYVSDTGLPMCENLTVNKLMEFVEKEF